MEENGDLQAADANSTKVGSLILSRYAPGKKAELIKEIRT